MTFQILFRQKSGFFADDTIVYREINLLQDCLELRKDLDKLMT